MCSTFQRTLGKSINLEVGFQRSESRHLGQPAERDQPLRKCPDRHPMPFPEWTGWHPVLKADRKGNYNGVSRQVRTALRTHLTTLVITPGRNLSTTEAPSRALDFTAQDSRCAPATTEFPTFNVPHRFCWSTLYTLPFGKGQAVLNHGGVVAKLLATGTECGSRRANASAEYGFVGSPGTGFSVSNRLNCVAAGSCIPNQTPMDGSIGAFTNTVCAAVRQLRAQQSDWTGGQVNFDFS